MKKLLKIISLPSLLLSLGLVSVSTAHLANPIEEAQAIPSKAGDLLGGCEAKMSAGTTDVGATFVLKFAAGNQDLSGDGVYIRMKNLTSTETPIQFYMNGTNGHRVQITPSSVFKTYDANLTNEASITTRSWLSYIMLPANFDGHIYIPYSIMMSQDSATWPTNSTTSMTYNSVYAMYFACSAFWDSYANFQIGDVFTDSKVVYDGSEVTSGDFGNFFAKDYEGTYWALTQLSGSKSEEVAFDYTSVTYEGEIDKGAEFHLSGQASLDSEFTAMNINFTEGQRDFSNADDMVFRVKNLSADYPAILTICDGDGKLSAVSASTVSSIKFYDGTTISNGGAGGNPISVKIPSYLDGYMIIPMSAFVGEASLSNIHYLNINIATYYDYGFNSVFGDMYTLKHETKALTQVIDVDALSNENFAANYTLAGVTSYGIITRYEVEKPSKWIGDVKLIDSLNYESDEELKKNITYDTGDNACTYNKQDDGMFVHIGPYETGHAYGSYMALGMFDKGVTTDRKVMTREVDGKTEYAKGITMYLKNLSRREIGINLQFDENTSSTAERWIVKGYPANYYAYDVNTGANYVLFAKSDQIQIPVGFEGYVRIPFESYEVPDWCHGDSFKGTDDVLNLDNFSGNLFLTADNTRYEDLEYFIKNVGVYFNKTTTGLLDSSTTIKANMGL